MMINFSILVLILMILIILLALLLLRVEEIIRHIIKLLKKLNHFQVPLFFNLTTGVLTSFPLLNLHTFQFWIINISKHYKPFFWNMFYLLDWVVTTFTILVHYIFTETVVPSLKFIVCYFIHLKATFDVTISIKSRSFIICYHVVLTINISIT